MSIITNLMGGGQIKLVALAVAGTLLLASAGGLYWQFRSLENEVASLTKVKNDLEASNRILQTNLDVVKDNMKKVSEACAVNEITARSLIGERSEAQKAINTLAASTVTDKATITKLYGQLNSIINDPANDGIVSPALRETIRNIQNNRK